MRVTCPNCDETIPADKINMQRMAAVCPVCDTVFSFGVPTAKSKRRKIKQPLHMSVHDSDPLHMAFRTNFRLDRNAGFLNASVISGTFALATVATMQEYAAAEVPIIIPLICFMAMMLAIYMVALVVFNRTHIAMDEDSIRVSRQPLPNPLRQPEMVSLMGVERIHYEETPISKREGYDTPRYQVWAETVDGRRKMIITDLIEEYAVYITQRLNERLEDDAAPPGMGRLNDDVWMQDDTFSQTDVYTTDDRKNHHRY